MSQEDSRRALEESESLLHGLQEELKTNKFLLVSAQTLLVSLQNCFLQKMRRFLT